MKKVSIFLLFILVIAFILRVIRLEELFYFNMDEALLAFRGWGLFALHRIFIIGGISPLGFHLPPYFYWLSAIVLKISGFDPAGWGVFASLISCLTIFFLYRLVQKIANTKIALITSLLYATSFTAVFFDRHYWPLFFNPLISVLFLWFLLAKSKYKWPILSLILVFAVSADPSNIPLLLIIIFYILKEKINLSKIIPAVIIFLVLFLGPLIVFDLRHKGSNIQGVEKFFQTSKNYSFQIDKLKDSLLLAPRFFSQFWYNPWTNISDFHTYCAKIAPLRQVKQPLILQVLAVIILFSYFMVKRKFFKNGEAYISLLLLIYVLSIVIYGGFLGRPIFEHYLAILIPIFAFITAKIINRFWVFGFFILVIFMATNLTQFSKATNPYGLKISKQAIDWIGQEVENQEFAFDTISSCFRYNGFRYLFETENPTPIISFIDPEFFWLYKQKPANYFPDKIVLITDSQESVKQSILSKNQFGNWQVFILGNPQKNYKIEGM